MGKSAKKTPVKGIVTPAKLNMRTAARRIDYANTYSSDLHAVVASLKAEKAELVAKNNAKDHMIGHYRDMAIEASLADNKEEAVTRELFLRMMSQGS